MSSRRASPDRGSRYGTIPNKVEGPEFALWAFDEALPHDLLGTNGEAQ